MSRDAEFKISGTEYEPKIKRFFATFLRSEDTLNKLWLLLFRGNYKSSI